MNQYLFFIGDYLKGKPIYPVARRILSLLFSISLSSFLFEKFYFKYDWVDITNYKAILDFFIKGDFFLPFSIFIVVHYLLDWISEGLFLLLVLKKSTKMLKEVYDYEFKKSDYKNLLETLNHNPVAVMPFELNKTVLIEFFKYLSTEISSEQWNQFEKSIEKQKSNIQESFKLALKALFTITVYFLIVPHFGLMLYIFIFIILTLATMSLFYGYLLMDVIPTAIRRFHYEVSKYLKEKENKQSIL